MATTLKKALTTTTAKSPKTTAKAVAKTTAKIATSPATTTQRKALPKATHADNVLGLTLKTWVGSVRKAKGNEARSGKRAFVFLLSQRDPKLVKNVLNGHLSKWQLQSCLDSEAESQMFQGANGVLWIVRPATPAKNPLFTSPGLEKSAYAKTRDAVGAIVAQLSAFQPDRLIIESHGLSLEEERGALVGLEMAAYSFKENRAGRSRKKLPEVLFRDSKLDGKDIHRAVSLGQAVNLARHFTNLPAAELNPRTYAEAVASLFESSSSMSVEIWEGEKLAEENMNLLRAVGRAAEEQPRLVHLRYRPANAPLGLKPIAIVGKGVTFDSGGLDIKPSSNMRNMKKDMGGSAAALGIAHWLEQTQLALPVDIYLSLAENAIAGNAFRPGDILTARNGMMVEISNTDAEGRLVLADAIDVAATQEDKPQVIINIATLTGAIKVGLGSEIAGLFSNSEELARQLFDAGTAKGDLMWRMPLFQNYRSMLKSSFADCMNSAESGFGGAITAALFLESFVRGIPWAHLDIYAWKDGASGAWSEAGGSGQAVQALTEALTHMASEGQLEELA